jgi:hypothetical protein
MDDEVRGGELPDWPAQSHREHKIDGYRYRSRDFFNLEWEKVVREPTDW